ncbi:MAG: extracellular solute-binding protein [Clostridiaceae bacterium]|nr:extracellular solute-binding protein [Clostridiaceae bacterium]
MKKRIISMALILGILVSASGCSSNSSKSSDSSSTGTTTNKPVKISLWHSFVGADQRAKFMEERMAAFKVKYPNIEIDEQKMPKDQYQTKLKTQAAAGSLPDAFLLWPNSMTKEFAKSNLIAPINDLLSKNAEWKDGFIPRALDEFTVEGKTYSAGLGVSVTSMVFYNKALFDKYNLTFPKTYEDLKEVVKVFAKNGIIPIALGNKAKWPMQSTIFSLMANRETGSEWLDNVLAKKGASFTDPQFVSSLTKVQELTKLGAFNKDYNSIDEVQMRDYFYKGQAAMTIDGSWILPDMIAKATPDLKKNLEIGVLPAVTGGKGDANTMSGVSSTGIVMNAKATPEQKEAIGKLIMFLTDKDAQQQYANYSIPVSYKNVTLDASKVDPIYSKVNDLIKNHPLVTVYDSALNSEQTDIINNGLQGIMVGEKPENVAKQLQAAVK